MRPSRTAVKTLEDNLTRGSKNWTIQEFESATSDIAKGTPVYALNLRMSEFGKLIENNADIRIFADSIVAISKVTTKQPNADNMPPVYLNLGVERRMPEENVLPWTIERLRSRLWARAVETPHKDVTPETPITLYRDPEFAIVTITQELIKTIWPEDCNPRFTGDMVLLVGEDLS